MKGYPTNLPREEMLMSLPRPRPRMCGRTALVMRMRPKTFTSNTRCAWATETSSAAPSMPSPALLTRTSIRPNRSITCWTTLLTDSSLVTSRARNVTPPPGVLPDTFRLVPTTSNPASARASAVALPRPEDAPVTSATGRFDVITDSLGFELRSYVLRSYDHTVLVGRWQEVTSGDPRKGS